MGGANRSPATIELYTGGVRVFLRWCETNAVAPELTKDTVNAFIANLLERGAEPATAIARQKALRQYSKWLAAEGELKEDPLLGLARPQQTTKVTDALADDQLTPPDQNMQRHHIPRPSRRGCRAADGRDRGARRRTDRHDRRRSGSGPRRRGGAKRQGRQAAAGALRAADRRRPGPLRTYSAQIRIGERRAVGRRAGPPARATTA